MADTLVDIGGVKIRLTLDDSDVAPKVDKTKKLLQTIDKTVATSVKAIAAVVTGAVAAITLAVRAAINNADELNKLSQKIGISVEQLSRLDYAAKLSDVSLESLQVSIGKLNKNINEVANGGADDVRKVFEQIGVSVVDSTGQIRDSIDIFTDVSDVLSRLPDGAQKTAIAMTLLGRSGADLIPLLNEGRQGLKELGDESDRLGNTISSKTAAAAEEFNDKITKLQVAVGGVANKLMVDLLPQLDTLITAISDPKFIQAVSDFAQGIITAIAAIAKAVGVTWDAVKGFWTFITEKDNASPPDPFLKLSPDEFVKQLDAARIKVTQLNDQFWIAKQNLDKAGDPDSRSGLSKQVDELDLALARAEQTYRRLQQAQQDVANAPKVDITPPSTGDGDTGGGLNLPPISTGPTKEQMQERLDQLRQLVDTEANIEVTAFNQQLKDLDTFHQQGLVSDAEFNELRQGLAEEHWDKMKTITEEGLTDLARFTAMSYQDQAKTIFGELESITAGVKDQNDVLFNINKGAAVANAIINAYEGISKSLSTYPMPLAAIMAGVHAAAGFAQVSAILATTRDSKSMKSTTGGSGGASTATAAQNSKPGPSANQNMYVEGLNPNSLFSGGMVQNIAERLLKFQEDGGKVLFVPN